MTAPADSTPPRLLGIGGGGVDGHVRDWSARLARAARRCGLDLEVADGESDLALLRGEPGISVFALDYEDPEAAARLTAERTASGAPGELIGVTSFRELGVMSAAVAAERVGLTWNSVATVRNVRRKDLCRAKLREAGLPQPRSRAFDSLDDALAFVRANEGPWVVKPSGSLGSQGVRMVSDPTEAADALRVAASFGFPILVEELVRGIELSAEGVFVQGRPHVVALTRKQVGSSPFYVSVGQTMPAHIDEEAREQAVAAVEAGLKAVGLTHSVFHVELWIAEDGAVVLGEMHARPGGDWIHLLVDECYGVDLIDVAVADLAGNPADPQPADPPRGAAMAAVVAEKAGVLERLEGVEAIASDPRCLAVDVKAVPGQEVRLPQTHYDRLALVVARGEDAGDAERAAQELAGRLRPVIGNPRPRRTQRQMRASH